MSYSEMQALASGDERIKEKIELDGDVARLRLLESEHYNAQYRLDNTISDCQKLIKSFTANIEAAKTDIDFAAEHKLGKDDFRVEIGGRRSNSKSRLLEAEKEYDEKYKALQKLIKASRKEIPISEVMDYILTIMVHQGKDIVIKWRVI